MFKYEVLLQGFEVVREGLDYGVTIEEGKRILEIHTALNMAVGNQDRNSLSYLYPSKSQINYSLLRSNQKKFSEVMKVFLSKE